MTRAIELCQALFPLSPILGDKVVKCKHEAGHDGRHESEIWIHYLPTLTLSVDMKWMWRQ